MDGGNGRTGAADASLPHRVRRPSCALVPAFGTGERTRTAASRAKAWRDVPATSAPARTGRSEGTRTPGHLDENRGRLACNLNAPTNWSAATESNRAVAVCRTAASQVLLAAEKWSAWVDSNHRYLAYRASVLATRRHAGMAAPGGIEPPNGQVNSLLPYHLATVHRTGQRDGTRTRSLEFRKLARILLRLALNDLAGTVGPAPTPSRFRAERTASCATSQKRWPRRRELHPRLFRLEGGRHHLLGHGGMVDAGGVEPPTQSFGGSGLHVPQRVEKRWTLPGSNGSAPRCKRGVAPLRPRARSTRRESNARDHVLQT